MRGKGYMLGVFEGAPLAFGKGLGTPKNHATHLATLVRFSLCLGVVLAAVGWISVTALNLDGQKAGPGTGSPGSQRKSRFVAHRFRVVAHPRPGKRRPYIAYTTFAPPGRVTEQLPNFAARTEALVSSPLSASPYVLVHFQFEPDGRLTSPNVPSSTPSRFAPPAQAASDEAVKLARKQLARIAAMTDRQRLAAMLPPSLNSSMQVVLATPHLAVDDQHIARRPDVQRLDRSPRLSVSESNRNKQWRDPTGEFLPQQLGAGLE